MDTKTFAAKIKAAKKSESTLRDNIQLLTVSAVDTFAQHGDTSRIEMLVNASVTMKSIRSAELKNFIKAHANVKFAAAKDQDGFIVKKIKGESVEVKTIESNWYEFSREGIAKPDLDLILKAKALLSSLDKAKEEGRAKVSSANDRLEAVLRSTLADLQAQ